MVRRPSRIFQLERPVEDVVLSPMNLEDLGEVMDIEARSFPTPWSRDMFLAELSKEHPWAVVEVTRPVVEARLSGQARQGGGPASDVSDRAHGRPISGYVDYWMVHDEVHLLSIAVAPAWRRRGLGRILLGRPISAGLLADCAHVVLEVRRGNEAAQHLYQSSGFRPVGVRRRYYSDTGEDAIVMMKKLSSDGEDERQD